MAAATAGGLMRSTSDATAPVEANNNEDGVLPSIELIEPIMKLTDDGGATYHFVKLRIGEHLVAYYLSSGRRSGFGGLWFPCWGIEVSGHILKGTNASVPGFFSGKQLLKDESLLERVASETGLIGMSVLNRMSEAEYGAFSRQLLAAAPTVEIRDKVMDALGRVGDAFLVDTDVKRTMAALMETAVDVRTREDLSAYLQGGGMIGGKRSTMRRWRSRRHRRA